MQFWNVFNDLEQVRRELDRVFDQWTTSKRPVSRVSFLPGVSARHYPMINMSDDNENIYIEALAPGVDINNLDISIHGNSLTLSGEKLGAPEDVKSDAYHRCERAAGKFVRTIELPANVNMDKVLANYKNGLLLITLPKAEEAKPKKIAITAG